MTSTFPWVVSIVGIIGFYLAGKKVWWAWYVNLANQALWLVYSITTQQWGFLLATLFYVGVFSKNAHTWTVERFGKPEGMSQRWRWWAHRMGLLPSQSCALMNIAYGWRKPNNPRTIDLIAQGLREGVAEAKPFVIDYNRVAIRMDPELEEILSKMPHDAGEFSFRCEDLNVDYDIICTRYKQHYGDHTGGGRRWANEDEPVSDLDPSR